MFVKQSGTPISGTVSLTNASPGPTNFSFVLISNGSAYTPIPAEVIVIVSLILSTNDTANPLITIDDGVTTGAYTSRIIAKIYSSSTVAVTMTMPPGVGVTRFGTAPRATAPAVTAAKTVEATIIGYVTRTI